VSGGRTSIASHTLYRPPACRQSTVGVSESTNGAPRCPRTPRPVHRALISRAAHPRVRALVGAVRYVTERFQIEARCLAGHEVGCAHLLPEARHHVPGLAPIAGRAATIARSRAAERHSRVIFRAIQGFCLLAPAALFKIKRLSLLRATQCVGVRRRTGPVGVERADGRIVHHLENGFWLRFRLGAAASRGHQQSYKQAPPWRVASHHRRTLARDGDVSRSPIFRRRKREFARGAHPLPHYARSCDALN
jgi:hypothetical protein